MRAANPELDPDLWLSDAMARLGQICRIEMAGQGAIGTGFLVGPDLVLTNEHVVRPVIEGEVQPRHVKLRFDQRVRTQIAASPTVALHQDRLVDVSPNGVYPFTSAPASHLDYALLHTKTQPGHHIVDRDKELSRGWIDPTLPAGVLDADTPLFVMGHPWGDALKLTFGYPIRHQRQRDTHPASLPHQHRGRIIRLALFRRQLATRRAPPRRRRRAATPLQRRHSH